MATPFFTDAESAIHQHVDVPDEHILKTSPEDFCKVYEISRSVEWISRNRYTKVALQFPDSLLVDAAEVSAALQRETSAKAFILGDTYYGSCCVDEVAAQHYNADCIIHYGRSCLSQTSHLPVLYVFGQQPIDVAHCCESFRQIFPDNKKKIVMLYDVVYAHACDIIAEDLKTDYSSLSISRLAYHSQTENSDLNLLSKTTDLTVIEHSGRTFMISGAMEDYSMFYIGEESLTLTNLIMTFNKCQFYEYNPQLRTCRKESQNVNKKLMKRYYMVEKAKDAQIVGIVVGTLGVAKYLSAIDRLKTITKQAGKKTYLFVMGKLNVAKMANFMEVDVYVLVACPENSLIDSTDFFKPIVTPFEMELACNQSREWTGQYVTEFKALLPGGCSHVEMPDDVDSEGGADVSLITGKVRTIGVRSDHTEPESTALVKRDDVLTVANVPGQTAGDFLAERSWQGLEQKLGQTPVTKATEGIRGIASGYTHEPGT